MFYRMRRKETTCFQRNCILVVLRAVCGSNHVWPLWLRSSYCCHCCIFKSPSFPHMFRPTLSVQNTWSLKDFHHSNNQNCSQLKLTYLSIVEVGKCVIELNLSLCYVCQLDTDVEGLQRHGCSKFKCNRYQTPVSVNGPGVAHMRRRTQHHQSDWSISL